MTAGHCRRRETGAKLGEALQGIQYAFAGYGRGGGGSDRRGAYRCRACYPDACCLGRGRATPVGALEVRQYAAFDEVGVDLLIDLGQPDVQMAFKAAQEQQSRLRVRTDRRAGVR